MVALSGKGAVVTGGSRGIGRAIVRRLAADGATVVFSFVSSAGLATEVEREVAEAGGRAHAVRADLALPGAVDELMAAADEHLDGLDILVNNAAAAIVIQPIADTDEAAYDLSMTVNAKTTFLTTRYAARQMRHDGRIINISTLNTLRPAPGSAPYVASKGAIEQLTKVAAVELGGRGITANAVCPGATDTDLLRSVNAAETLGTIAKMTSLGRLGEPADIADVVAMLAGPDGRWITGQVLHVNGGLL
jgi:3-oxoacyl-[acyl-carrier protein] reductase